MTQVINVNDYIKKVAEELESLDEFFKVKIYGGEFNSDNKDEFGRMPANSQSNGLIAFVEALEAGEKSPNFKAEEMTVIFVVYILNKTDRGMNGYSSNAYAHGQRALQLIKNNNFGFNMAKKPNILSLRNINNEIKQDKEIAKMALVWSQDMVLAETNRFN